MLPALATLREHVYRLGLSLPKLEKLTGISRGTTGPLFKGQANGRTDTIAILCQGIGLEPCTRCGALGYIEPEETNP